MSYARWGYEGSDVYVFGTGDGFICMHQDSETFHCLTEGEMIEHLKEHRRIGDTVPESALERLREEMNQ